MIDYYKLNGKFQKVKVLKYKKNSLNDKNIILWDNGIKKNENVIRFEIMLKRFKIFLIFCSLFFSIIFCNFELIKISIFLICILIFLFCLNLFDFEEKIINIFTEDIYLEKTIKEAKKYNIENIEKFKQNFNEISNYMKNHDFDFSFRKEMVNKTLNIFYSKKKEDCNEFIIVELLKMLK